MLCTSLGHVALHSSVCLSGRICTSIRHALSAPVGQYLVRRSPDGFQRRSLRIVLLYTQNWGLSICGATQPYTATA